MTKLIAPIIVSLILIVFGWFAIFESPAVLRTEYTAKIYVETPDKIENAISNVVSDLEKRDFTLVYLEVKWYPAIKTYKILVRGIDRTKLCEYEP